MESISNDILWNVMLEIRNRPVYDYIHSKEFRLKFSSGTCHLYQCTFNNTQKQFIITISGKSQNDVTESVSYSIDENNTISQLNKSFFDSSANQFLKQYLPFCFAKSIALKLKRAYSIVHLAQSIDGRIATEGGDSKWVSCTENLVHAHRMRALCDAILIGSNTLKADSPRLTVRHVKGPNPVKVVVANKQCNLENLTKDGGHVLLFTANKNFYAANDVEVITLPHYTDNIQPELILKELYKRNIYSLFIEGGAITASSFLKNNSVDKLQIFISPHIFGSGINSFKLPSISKVQDSRNFQNFSFHKMGDGILFEGDPVKIKEKSKKAETEIREVVTADITHKPKIPH